MQSLNQIHSAASIGNTSAINIFFCRRFIGVLIMALEALHEEANPLGLQVSWDKSKVQLFGGLLAETVHFTHTCGENIKILNIFTLLGSVLQNNGGSRQ